MFQLPSLYNRQAEDCGYGRTSREIQEEVRSQTGETAGEKGGSKGNDEKTGQIIPVFIPATDFWKRSYAEKVSSFFDRIRVIRLFFPNLQVFFLLPSRQ
jgi:hypothetical protein